MVCALSGLEEFFSGNDRNLGRRLLSGCDRNLGLRLLFVDLCGFDGGAHMNRLRCARDTCWDPVATLGSCQIQV